MNWYFGLVGIIIIFVLTIIYLLSSKEFFNSFNNNLDCELYGNDYNSCYSNSNCTIGFKSDGSTHCMKKFLYEDI